VNSQVPTPSYRWITTDVTLEKQYIDNNNWRQLIRLPGYVQFQFYLGNSYRVGTRDPCGYTYSALQIYKTFPSFLVLPFISAKLFWLAAREVHSMYPAKFEKCGIGASVHRRRPKTRFWHKQPSTKPTDLGCVPACGQLSPTPTVSTQPTIWYSLYCDCLTNLWLSHESGSLRSSRHPQT